MLKPYTVSGYMVDDDFVFSHHVTAESGEHVRPAVLDAILAETNEMIGDDGHPATVADLGRVIITGVFEGHVPFAHWLRED